mmetsp:Transcript_19780/g.49856  ORF Transcript_19780/g.49856 Transcript_19780/m.49856 type:complete len:83 (-) Transcript_19780:977-1225(-)
MTTAGRDVYREQVLRSLLAFRIFMFYNELLPKDIQLQQRARALVDFFKISPSAARHIYWWSRDYSSASKEHTWTGSVLLFHA